MMHKSLPKLDLNVTNRCNFRCVHCAFDSGIEQMSELSLDELRDLLDETKELGGERIDVTGGEATVREDVDKIIRTGKYLGYRIELVTNGSLLTRNRLMRYRDMGLDSIAVSVDGSDYDRYRMIRGVDEETYRRVIQTIEDAVDLGINTKVNTAVFESNMEDLPAIAEQCVEMGVSENGIYYFTPVGRGHRTGQLSVEPLRWLGFLRERLQKYGDRIKYSVEIPLIEEGFPDRETGCILKQDPYHLQVLPDGNVYPCAILASYHLPIGNLHEKSVREIWEDDGNWERYRSLIDEGVFERYDGFCADFSGFNEEGYPGYRFVCPLRKFSVGDLSE